MAKQVSSGNCGDALVLGNLTFTCYFDKGHKEVFHMEKGTIADQKSPTNRLMYEIRWKNAPPPPAPSRN